MGTNSLTTKTNTAIVADDFNQFKAALGVDLVPRNVSGVPTNEAGSLGNQDYQWLNARVKNLFVDGNQIVPDLVTARTYRLISGKATADGYPNFLTAAGHGSGLSATLDCTPTALEAVVNGTSVEVESDLSFSSLTAAPGSNNTCAINDAAIANYWPEVLGEWDERVITINSVGSEITALNGTVAAFKTAANEVFLALVDTTNNCLRPILRGWAGTSRGTLAHAGTITLLKVSTLLLKKDGATKVASTYYPESVASFPAAGTAGKVYWNRVTGATGYDDGATVSEDYIVVGWAICDSADCEWVQPADFDLFWSSESEVSWWVDDTTSLRVGAGSSVSVAGVKVEFPDEQHVTQASDLDTGVSLAADTRYWLYATKAGALVVSDVAPRWPDPMRLGWYHPQKYYRAVGVLATPAGATTFMGPWDSITAEPEILNVGASLTFTIPTRSKIKTVVAVGAASTVTLPPAAKNYGRTIVFRNISTGIDIVSSEFGGLISSPYTLTGARIFVSNGTYWVAIDDPP